jgi:hypothetical protein
MLRLRRLEKKLPPRWRLFAYGVILMLITSALGVIAYRLMFSTFDVPDDVGYALMSLRKFNQGEALYDGVYSQYGPGVYVLVGGALRLFRVGLTDEAALFVNLVLWLASSLIVGLLLLRLTRRLLVSAIGVVLAFLVLTVDVNEPLHPGATISFLLAALILAAAYLLPSRPRAAMAAVGMIVAALLSLKVNVGLFALLSVAFACSATIPTIRRHEVLRVLVTIAFVTIPFPLMSENLGESWALRYAVIVSMGALALALISTRLRAVDKPDGRGVAAMVLGFLAVLVLVTVVPIAGGTSPKQLVEGWFIRPAGTAGIAHAALLVHPLSWIWAALGVGLAVVVHRAWTRPFQLRLQTAAATGRVAAGLLMWLSLTGPILKLPGDLTQGMVVGAPLVWVAAIPPRGRSDQSSFLRLLIPALASLQFLHAYPMPGSQLTWSVFLLVPVGGICVADGLEELSELAISWGTAVRVAQALATAALLVFGTWLCLKPLRTEARAASARYDESVSLGLPGATRIRVTPPLAEQLQSLVAGIRQHCDTFLTLPGMNSLNLLSEEEPPVELSSPWPFFFSTSEQQRIVERVRSTPGLCVVYKPDLVEFWGGYFGGAPPRRPLIRFMEDEFRPIRNYSGYFLMVRDRQTPRPASSPD